jgi:hypothetical protein
MKKKLKLQIEKLRVEQFEVHPDSPVARGTVHGHESDYSDGDATCVCGIGPSEPWRYCADVPETHTCYC